MRWTRVAASAAAAAFALAGLNASPANSADAAAFDATSVRSVHASALGTEQKTPIPVPALTPLAGTHAHNDYLHEHPLFDALSHRFSSVEVDVWLSDDGSLLVGHTKSALSHGQTVEGLYLNPLKRLAAANGGHVYRDSNASVQLLVDVKTAATATYNALDRRLRNRYSDLLTSWSNGVEHRGAVTVVVSGNRDRSLMESQSLRYAAYDGRLSDLGDGSPATFMPLISDNWSSVFKWKGTGTMPSDERARLRGIVRQAHENNQRVRFYNTPDSSPSQRVDIWREETAAGVDWLNTDELAALEYFLTNPMARAS